MNTKPRVMFATGVGTVTGSNFVVQAPDGAGSTLGAQILVDCGLVQGEKVALDMNRDPFPYKPADIRALIITHAHLDHVGRIPKLVKEGFHGPIYSTPQTRELAELVLNDAVGILQDEARRGGVLPLYELPDVQKVFPLWKTIPYHQAFEPAPGFSVTLKDAGHILGSSMVELTIGAPGDPATRTMLFTGDLGNSPAPLLRDTEPAGDIDYLAMESTYGDKNHESRDQRLEIFTGVITSTLARGGTLIIPSFAIDRTQVLIYELNQLIESGKIPRVPVFVDSPLAIKATEVYHRSEDLFNDTVRAQIARGDDIFRFPGLEYAMTGEESRHADRLNSAKIILAGSGMSAGGRIVSHEETFLPDARSTVLLVGYQAAGSLGRELADGARTVRIHDHDVNVRARIETLYGYSAHKDSDHLVGFASTATSRLRRIFVILGEPHSSMHLAQRLNDELHANAGIPELRKWYELE